MHTLCIRTTLGPITITEEDGAITELSFRSSKDRSPTPLLRQCAREVQEYFAGKRNTFTVPLKANGTPFDEAVQSAMQKVKFGDTVSYAELAKRIGKAKACRAVANACGRNRTPILIPCHRVVASNGLGGFNSGIKRKKILLGIEGHTL